VVANNVVLCGKGDGAQRAEGKPREAAPAKPAEVEPDDHGYDGGAGDDDLPF
jgi:hypothetical protein